MEQIFCPFRANTPWWHVTQGDALGYVLSAPLGR